MSVNLLSEQQDSIECDKRPRMDTNDFSYPAYLMMAPSRVPPELGGGDSGC